MCYEFGTKFTIAATIEKGFIVGAGSWPGNPYDGDTLQEALAQVEVLTDIRPSLAVIDQECRGHELFSGSVPAPIAHAAE